MRLDEFWRKRVWKWALFASFWSLLGFAFASRYYISTVRTGRLVSWGEVLHNSLIDWYLFALLSIPVRKLSRQWSFDRSPKWRSVLVHAVCGPVFSVLYVAVRFGIARWENVDIEMGKLLTNTFLPNLLVYWVIVGVSHGFDYYQKYRDRELHTVELERSLTEAKLHALQMQLNPHFLFNALHSISTLMHRDVEAADEMLAKLSELLRLALDNTSAQEVPLKKELAFLERYLEIEQIRFGERLKVTMDIQPETLDVSVPNLILQPLVENAIKHGIEPHKRTGVVELKSHREGDHLLLRVQDNGGGLNGDLDEGIGVSNTKARLQQLYGAEHHFTLRDGAEQGVVAEITIPWRVKV
jgi:signal transduction histidine kinase